MSATDMQRLLLRFIETERATIVQCAHSVALDYHTNVLKKAANPTVDAVRDSIVRDPARAFTDEGLNHAVVYYLTRLKIDVAVVMRPGPPGSACLTFVPKGKPTGMAAAALPCVLISMASSGHYRIEHEGPKMADVWAYLRSQQEVQASFVDARSRLEKLTIPAIHPLAAMVGMAFGGGQDPRSNTIAFGGKGGLLDAIMSIK